MSKKPLFIITLISFILLLTACQTTANTAERGPRRVSYGRLLAENQVNIERISPGISEQDVMKIMGMDSSRVKRTYITNPFKRDFFTVGNNQYEILYYLTRPYPKFTAIRVSQATPVVIKNGRVVGIGASALDRIRNEE